MSDTDKTRPWKVKCLDDPTWLVESHNHATGACDLPPRPTKTASPYGDPAARCTWIASNDFWTHSQNGCGCPGCTLRDARRAQRRRERKAARRAMSDERAFSTAARATTTAPSSTHAAHGPSDPHLDADYRHLASLAAPLGLPATSHVVALDAEDTPEVRVEILHNDGSREVLIFEMSLADLIEQTDAVGTIPHRRDHARG